MKKLSMLLSLLLALGLCTACGGRERVETGQVVLNIEMPAQHSLEDMIEEAPYIVRGVWKDRLEDTQSEYGDTYSRFTFEVTDVLQGDLDPGPLTVSQRSAIFHKIKIPDEPNGYLQLGLPDPYFIKPESGTEAILLLRTVSGETDYFTAKFPWLLEVDGNDLIANTHYLEKATVEKDFGYDPIYVVPVTYGNNTFDDDFLDGLTVEGFMDEVNKTQ